MFSSWRPNNLPPEIIKKINADLVMAVSKLEKNIFTGRVLDFIYRDQHGISSHGFELEELYRVFVTPKGKVLVLKEPHKEGNQDAGPK
jgi:hypothetical protein